MADARSLDGLENWGRWGADDELGTLNLIDGAAVRRGLAAARQGVVVSMARELIPGQTPGVSHRMLIDPSGEAAVDAVEIAPHGLDVTHLDAVSHMAHRGRVYNGRHLAEVTGSGGLAFGGIGAMGGGIVTRGILLDVAGARGVEALRPGDSVTAADLDQAAERAGIHPEPGDALVVLTGVGLQSDADRTSKRLRTGLELSCVEWMRDHDTALYAGDCIEASPSSGPFAEPLHTVGLAGLGLALVDAPVLDSLAEACRRFDQWEFLFVCAPLRIRGATGSAVNPLAVL